MNKIMYCISILFNICASAILIFLAPICLSGAWVAMNIMGKYEYGEGAKLITVIIYHITYYSILFAPIQILIATLVSIFLIKNCRIILSILIHIFSFIILFFMTTVYSYLV